MGLYFGVALGVLWLEITAFLGKGNDMRRHALALLLSLIVLLGASVSLAIPVAHVQLWSEPGDPIGLGRTSDVVYDTDDDILRLLNPCCAIDGNPTTLILIMAGPYTGKPSVQLTFGTSLLGSPLQPGSYPNVPSIGGQPGYPQLLVQIDGRRPGSLTGQFTIREIVNGYGYTEAIVADFVQYANGSTSALRGTIEWRDTGLTNIPEPSTALLMLLGLAGLNCRRLAA